jgi:hypothetical protein
LPERLQAGADVADFGCGSGHAVNGAGLGTAWGKQLALSMLADAGFKDVAIAEIETDPINYYYIAKK